MRLPTIGFGAKASIGMIIFALAPCYCAYALFDAKKQGVKLPSDDIIRHAKVENPFSRSPPPELAPAAELDALRKELAGPQR